MKPSMMQMYTFIAKLWALEIIAGIVIIIYYIYSPLFPWNKISFELLIHCTTIYIFYQKNNRSTLHIDVFMYLIRITYITQRWT